MAEYHCQQLPLCCRLCAARVRKARAGRATRAYDCSELSDTLKEAFGICIKNEGEMYILLTCVGNAMIRSKEATHSPLQDFSGMSMSQTIAG